MARTPIGHLRRIKGWLTTPNNDRGSLYGLLNNYRTRDLIAGAPTGATVSPDSGASPLDCDASAVANPILALPIRENLASAGQGLTILGTAYARVDDTPVPGPVKTSRFDWNDAGDVDDVPFDTVSGAAHTYTGAGERTVDITNFDALGRATQEQELVDVT